MQVYDGKAKRMRPLSETEIEVVFKDDATAFNGQKHEVFAGKGELNSRISEMLFELLESKGIATQHLRRTDERTLIAKRATMFALEVVVRFKVAGSLQKRTGLPDGTVCEPAIHELYFKRDDLGDPLINEDHVSLLKIATLDELIVLREMASAISLHLRELFSKARIDLFDMKFEFGRTPDGKIILADEISPDTCRFRDMDGGGMLDKDRFRQGKGDLLEGYREVHSRLTRVLEKLS
ncbi:MAG: phosphoribosylaminoimidazolesuccinocarboxamide synthase [Clostridia bacterium]|nr:phosphoribosylaminoimidazolesuccinocarboxamide synthase [Deltaproteobacteria bacterium]